MSWFTENIRDPLENAVAGMKPASPSVPTATGSDKLSATNSITDSPYFIPLAIGAALIIVVFFFKR